VVRTYASALRSSVPGVAKVVATRPSAYYLNNKSVNCRHRDCGGAGRRSRERGYSDLSLCSKINPPESGEGWKLHARIYQEVVYIYVYVLVYGVFAIVAARVS